MKKAHLQSLASVNISLYFWVVLFFQLLTIEGETQSLSNNQSSKSPTSLQLPFVFGSHMVIQQGKPIKFYGLSKANSQVLVVFNGVKQTAEVDSQGKWEATFAAMQAGGPFQAVISNSDTSVIFQDILVGEVWLCSGQSNMAFPLSAAIKDAGEMNAAQKKYQLRLLNRKVIAETNNEAWNETTLNQVNHNEYFSGEWKPCDSINANSFSAVAYFFGKTLEQSLNVPVGLIQVAVGGSPIESWIDKYTMEQHPLLAKELVDWRHSSFYQPWVKKRAGANLKMARVSGQRHPFEPYYSFEAGIQPLTHFPIAGVIWYQGESNAHNPELYKVQFPELVKSWRNQWGYEFPFYFVQLSSINRDSWPAFRYAQFQLSKQITNSGMAVSSDYGDFSDVHPKAKKPIGERLAKLALAYHYGQKGIIANGPEILTVKKKRENIQLRFKYAQLLKTSDGKDLRGFKLVDETGKAYPTFARIKKNKVIINRNKSVNSVGVYYGWEPYTDANLVNEANLPASTFKVSIK